MKIPIEWTKKPVRPTGRRRIKVDTRRDRSVQVIIDSADILIESIRRESRATGPGLESLLTKNWRDK